MKVPSARPHVFEESSCKRVARRKWLLLAAIALMTLPSTRLVNAGGVLYFVNTTSDAVVAGACANGLPNCSLRGAIQAANSHPGEDGIDIDLPAGSVINLTGALPDITDSVSITGFGPNSLTVRRDTGGDYRIFNVTTAGTVSFSGLTISNGYTAASDGYGGGINNDTGTVNVTNCTLSGNAATSVGGAISNNTGTVNILNSTFLGNSAPKTGMFFTDGGGVGNLSGTVNVTTSTLTGNSASNGGGIYNYGTVTVSGSTLSGNTAGVGGGIFNDSQGTLTVINSTINSNSVTDIGGGIRSEGTLTLTGSTLNGNSATNSGARGGGLSFAGTTANITNSTINGNSAAAGFGGGIRCAGEVNISNSTISNNSTYQGGGIFSEGVLNVTNSTISNNSDQAGGIFAYGPVVNITNSTITSNQAEFCGGLRSTGNGWTVKSSIIALNTASTAPDILDITTSQGFNLIGKNDGAAATFPAGNPNANNDIVGTSAAPIDPKLDPTGLQNKGGPTRTIALLPDSPAIDKGTSNGLTGMLTTDQRGTGFLRTRNYPSVTNASGGDGTDIGAFEFGGPLVPISVSRKTHGAANFDIYLPLSGTPGIECRTGGASGNHQLIMAFPSQVTVSSAGMTRGIGSVSSHSVNGSKVTVNLTGVANAQKIVITLFGVSNGTNTKNVAIPMGVLLGDTTGNGTVNSSDVSLTKSKSGQAANASNFRTDVTINGSINSSDVSLVKSKSGTALP